MSTTPPAFCVNCGSALTPDTAFCEQCGSRIEAVAAEPQPAAFLPPPPLQQTIVPPDLPVRRGVPLVRIALLALVAAALGVGGVWLWVEFRKVVPEASVPARPPAVPAAPGAVPDSTGAASNTSGVVIIPPGAPPVEVAYRHFMNEVHGRLGDKLSVGSPHSTPTRIEVSVIAEGKPETVVVLEQSNTGKQASVIIGPKDAGAVRSYHLKRTAEGWSIVRFLDLEG